MLSLILLTISGGLTAAFLLLFSKYRKTVKTFRETEEELEEAKTVLEIRVSSRTEELNELVANLDVEVQRRTHELQERMADLERFRRLAVGRELKMIELKEEIKKLKEEIEKEGRQI